MQYRVMEGVGITMLAQETIEETPTDLARREAIYLYGDEGKGMADPCHTTLFSHCESFLTIDNLANWTLWAEADGG